MVKFHKGTKADFEKIKCQKKFYKVNDIYIDEFGDVYYCVEEIPEAGNEKKIDNNEKILYNINIE